MWYTVIQYTYLSCGWFPHPPKISTQLHRVRSTYCAIIQDCCGWIQRLIQGLVKPGLCPASPRSFSSQVAKNPHFSVIRLKPTRICDASETSEFHDFHVSNADHFPTIWFPQENPRVRSLTWPWPRVSFLLRTYPWIVTGALQSGHAQNLPGGELGSCGRELSLRLLCRCAPSPGAVFGSVGDIWGWDGGDAQRTMDFWEMGLVEAKPLASQMDALRFGQQKDTFDWYSWSKERRPIA